MACRHLAGTTAPPPLVIRHPPPRRPRWTARARSPSRTVADVHAAPPAAAQATASAAFLSPQQPNPVIVPSTPRYSRCCDDQLNPPCTPWSEWMTAPAGGVRVWMAMPRALVTSAAVGVASIDQPTTRREKLSRTTPQ